MNYPFAFEAQYIINALTEASTKIKQVDTADFMPVRNSILSELNKRISSLSITQMGKVVEPFEISDNGATQKNPVQPLTMLFGRVIGEPLPNTRPNKIELEELKDAINKLHPIFLNIPDEDLLDNKYSELAIRGVAKRAGLPVTETSPKKIDIKLIKKIKKALQHIESRVKEVVEL